MNSIEEDNFVKLYKYKFETPNPSYIAGFIDGDGCIFIRKIKDGYQSGISLAQSRTNILQIVRYHFGGTITSSTKRNSNVDNLMNDNYYHKHNKRNQYNLIIRSNEYEIILKYIKNHLIIKRKQLDCLNNFIKIVNKPNKKEEKEIFHTLCSQYNKNNVIDDTYLSALNIEYIQGLFDAEGCIYINKNLKKYRISIAQKNYPTILIGIQKLLGFGIVKEKEYKFYIYSKKECLKFINLIKPGSIVKYNQLIAFEVFLNTNDIIIREQIYKLTNEEKHKTENFNDLNNNETNKCGYNNRLNYNNVMKELKS